MRATLETVVCPGCGVVFRSWGAHANHGKYSKTCTPVMRFWARVNKNTPTKCWIWTGCVDKWGYGDISYMGKHVQAHRLSWRLLMGEPGDLDVLHKCDTPPCCNPDHLYLGTDADNNRDMRVRGRAKYNTRPKLTEDQVREIRALRGTASQRQLSEKYGVSQSAISCVQAGRSWKNL